MRPRVVSPEAYEEIANVIKQRDAIPRDADLARKYGVSHGYIRQIIYRLRKLGNTCDVSTERLICQDPASEVPRNVEY